MNTVNVTSELNKIATQLETLSKEVRANLLAGKDSFAVANELVKNAIMLTFGLGELYALTNAKNVVSTPTTSKKVAVNWHRPRDNRGRFAQVIRP